MSTRSAQTLAKLNRVLISQLAATTLNDSQPSVDHDVNHTTCETCRIAHQEHIAVVLIVCCRTVYVSYEFCVSFVWKNSRKDDIIFLYSLKFDGIDRFQLHIFTYLTYSCDATLKLYTTVGSDRWMRVNCNVGWLNHQTGNCSALTL